MRFSIILGRAAALLIVFWSCASAGRLYGTANLAYQYFDRTNGYRNPDSSIANLSSTSNYDQQTFLVNYDDLLFAKNALHFGANIYRQQLEGVSQHQVRPIYSMDLRSAGYFLSTSYSPYSLISPGNDSLGLSSHTVVYRDWRNTVTVSYPKYPTGSFIYNRTRTFDRLTPRDYDAVATTTILESNYSLGPVSARANYNRLRQQDFTNVGYINTIRAYTGALSFARTFARIGYVNAGYSYFDTRTVREAVGAPIPFQGHTHSVSAFYSSQQYKGMTVSSSYSGRFSANEQGAIRTTPSDETISGQVAYTPVRFVEVDALHGYQSSRDGANLITEYTTLTTSFTRYLRHGVDTRLSANRTWFHRSSQVSADNPRGKYALDTYYGSFAFLPIGYFRTLLDISLSHNSRPLLETQRYQLSRSINGQLYFSKRLEGRITAMWLDQSPTFRLDRTYSVTYNAGFTYYPAANMNANFSYIYSSINADTKTTTGTFSGFLGYTYRQAYSLYVSVNRQLLESAQLGNPAEKVTLKPYSANASLQIFLSRRTTLTVGYLYTRRDASAELQNREKQYSATLNVQF